MTLTLTPSYTDNFNRANVNPLASPWVADKAGDPELEIASDVCQSASGNNATGAMFLSETLPNDQYCSATVASLPNTSGSPQLQVWIRATDNSAPLSEVAWNGYTFWVFRIIGLGVFWHLISHIGGTLASGSGITVNVGDIFTLACIGSTVYLLHNGIQLAAVTNTTWTSGGTALQMDVDSSGNYVQVSDFAVGAAALLTSDPVFLGSVRVVAAPPNTPAGAVNPFLGTVSVISSAPAGQSNPYLGQVVVVASPPNASLPNPSIGEVVILGSAPAATDPFLGSVIES